MNLSMKDELIYVFKTEKKIRFFTSWRQKLQKWLSELFLI